MAPTGTHLPRRAFAALSVLALGLAALPLGAQTTPTTKPSTATGTPQPAGTASSTTKPKAGTAATAKPGTASKPSGASMPAKPAATKPATTKPATTPPKPVAPRPAAAAPPKTPAPRTESPKPVSPPEPAPPPAVQATPLREAGPVGAPATPNAAAVGPAAAGVAATPSFLQRHPVIGGFATGLFGASLAESMLGGPPEPQPGGAADANLLEPMPQAAHAAETAGQFTRLALFGGLVYLGVATWRRKSQETEPAAPGLRERTLPSVSDWEGAGKDEEPAYDGLAHPVALREIADEQDFAEILRAVQSAWSEGNVALLRARVTPEMADHYNDALAQNARNGIESRVECVDDVRVERLRDWEEDGLKFATARLRWKALDYLIDAAKTPDEPGYVIDGSAEAPVECEETWTFVKAGEGAWVLTDVEAVA